jgi:hypothetical protein
LAGAGDAGHRGRGSAQQQRDRVGRGEAVIEECQHVVIGSRLTVLIVTPEATTGYGARYVIASIPAFCIAGRSA